LDVDISLEGVVEVVREEEEETEGSGEGGDDHRVDPPALDAEQAAGAGSSGQTRCRSR
jgi:hypothetical protein